MAGALLLLAVTPALAGDGLTETLNKLRAQACGAQALHPNTRLDQLARLLSQGTRLQEAERQAGYHATKILSLTLSGVSDEPSLEKALGRERCAQLGAKDMSELGTYRRGSGIWIVLGQPFRAPDARDSDTIARQVLDLTNRARAQAHSCGGKIFPAAPPLTLDPRLTHAALLHSRDMAAHGYMDHIARDGSTPADRVTRTGYPWRLVGENLASGVASADEAVMGWLNSPPHCANLMGPEYQQMGVAFGVNMDSPDGVYWTQVLASRPRDSQR